MMQRLEEWAIYEAEGKYGTDRYVIVKDFGNYCETLMLVDIQPMMNALRIGDEWTDCGRLSYTFSNKFGEMVRPLTAGEQSEVKKGIFGAFGISGESEPADRRVLRAEAQRDVYKELYERAVAGRG